MPIAPTITFTKTEPDSNAFLSTYVERIGEDTTKLKTVAWQHLGVDLSGESQTYSSGRINRKDALSDKRFSFFQAVDHTDLPGNRLKLEAAIKADLQGKSSSAELYIRATDENNRSILSDHAVKVPNNSEEWQRIEVVGRLDPNAVHIGVGLRFNGIGRLWVDDVRLEAKNGEGDWESVPVINAGFEMKYSGKPSNWSTSQVGGFDVKMTEDAAYGRNKSFSISSTPGLFDQYPNVGETVVTEIDRGLWSEVPLALFSNEAHTLPRSSQTDFNSLKKSLKTINLNHATANDENVWLADIIIAWNELQHFYPYFDVVDTDWDKQLNIALKKALADDTQKDFTLP